VGEKEIERSQGTTTYSSFKVHKSEFEKKFKYEFSLCFPFSYDNTLFMQLVNNEYQFTTDKIEKDFVLVSDNADDDHGDDDNLSEFGKNESTGVMGKLTGIISKGKDVVGQNLTPKLDSLVTFGTNLKEKLSPRTPRTPTPETQGKGRFPFGRKKKRIHLRLY
jgi:hypothetical protein